MNEEQKNVGMIDEKFNLLIFSCPHCAALVEIEKDQINCAIFRHGYFFEKSENGEIRLTSQMNPHAPKDECELLVSNQKVVGCAKPFRISKVQESYVIEICDYV